MANFSLEAGCATAGGAGVGDGGVQGVTAGD